MVSFGESEGNASTSRSPTSSSTSAASSRSRAPARSRRSRSTATTLQTFAGTGLTLFFGEGPMTLANGQQNPLARGLLITNATVGLIRTKPGRPLRARRARHRPAHRPPRRDRHRPQRPVHVRVNSFDKAIDQTLHIEGTTNDVHVKFMVADDERSNGTTRSPRADRDRPAARRARLLADRRLHLRQSKRRPADHRVRRRAGAAGPGRVRDRTRTPADRHPRSHRHA